MAAFEEYEYEFRVSTSNTNNDDVCDNTAGLGCDTTGECNGMSIAQNRETVLQRAAHAVHLVYSEPE